MSTLLFTPKVWEAPSFRSLATRPHHTSPLLGFLRVKSKTFCALRSGSREGRRARASEGPRLERKRRSWAGGRSQPSARPPARFPPPPRPPPQPSPRSPSGAQPAARCRAGVPGARRSTVRATAQVGPWGLEEGERGLGRSGRTPAQGRETEAVSGACRVKGIASPATTAAPVQACPRPKSPAALRRSRRRARPHAFPAGSRCPHRRPRPPSAARSRDSLEWPARTLRGRRARLGEVWELQPAPPVGLLAAHFRVWTVTRRAAQAEGTHSISPVSLGHLPTPGDDIELSGWPVFNNDLSNSLSENRGNCGDFLIHPGLQ